MFCCFKIKLKLKRNLSSYRYEHCLRVAKLAKKLAKIYGVNEMDAYLAGLLHDVAKEFSFSENKMLVEKYNLSEELLGDDNIKICHAEIGSLIAKELYCANDSVCQAIRYHVSGNVGMNLLDKIVFVADKIEPGKVYPGIEKERALAYKDIDKALILCLTNTKKKLEEKGGKFNDESEQALIYFRSKVND